MDATAWAAIVGPITTLLGGLGGYWLAGRNAEAQDRRAGHRETAARRAALADRLEEDRHAFQRDTLLELQDQLQRLAEFETSVMRHYEQDLNEHGRIGKLPEDLNTNEFAAFTAVQRLCVRVLDNDLREKVLQYAGWCSKLRPEVLNMGGEPLKSLTGREEGLRQRYLEVNNRLGELLRGELDRTALAREQPDEGSE